MRYLSIIGGGAAVLLIAACFMPWTYHADLNKTFTGFFSENQYYGKPGKFLIFFSLCYLIPLFLNKTWSVRVMLFASAIALSYAIKSYILFASCYNTYCPDKKIGLYLILLTPVIMLAIAILMSIRPVRED